MKIRLPNVTLLTITSIGIDSAHKVLLRCANHVRFGAIKMFTPMRPLETDRRVEYVSIPHIDIVGYNRFVLSSLSKHVGTDYCLIVQSDGFILNPRQWDDRFLAYDYIGAPWSERLQFADGSIIRLNNRVGNGGFSLRSKKLLEATSRIDQRTVSGLNEDVAICHFLYESMIAAGIRFAPIELAARFSMEAQGILEQSLNSVFGFHGKHLLPLVYNSLPTH